MIDHHFLDENDRLGAYVPHFQTSPHSSVHLSTTSFQNRQKDGPSPYKWKMEYCQHEGNEAKDWITVG